MKKTVKLGYIGLGRRGHHMIELCFGTMADVQIPAICDVDPAKLERSAKMMEGMGLPRPTTYTDYKQMLAEADIDAVIIMTGWNGRIKCAIDCMEAGKYTAIEVGCAYDISECHALVDAYERTGSPVMMLENSCYERRVLAAIRMEREGVFGELVYLSGGYYHYLNDLDLFSRDENGVIDTNHYRLAEYVYRNCDQYPTHELGPLSKILRLNRGNRALSLTSFATKSCGLAAYVKKRVPEDHPYYNTKFKQGDIITTIIKCAGGEQITLMLDTTLPRALHTSKYSVRGTKGMMDETSNDICTYYLEGMPEKTFDNEPEFLERFDHPLYQEWSKMEQRGGHGGIDWLTCRAFIESVKLGIEPPIDVYDTALWAAIGPLSEASIANGSTAVEIPDFTKGQWFRRGPGTPCKYSLDLVCSDPDTPIIP